MTIYLRQSTASQEVLLGPAIDDTDFKTPKTGLTIANTDIKVWKAGATTLANKNSGGATEISGGYYYGVFDATDTDTAGSMRISIKVATALIIFMDVCVLPAQVYDSLVLGTDLLDANTAQWLGTACATPTTAGVPEVDITHIAGSAVSTSTAQLGVNVVNAAGTAWGSGAITAASIATGAIDADALAADAVTEIRDKIIERTCIRGAATTGTLSTTQMTTTGMSPAMTAANQLAGQILMFDHDTTTAALRGQKTDITASSAAANPLLTFTALTTAPASGDTFTIG